MDSGNWKLCQKLSRNVAIKIAFSRLIVSLFIYYIDDFGGLLFIILNKRNTHTELHESYVCV